MASFRSTFRNRRPATLELLESRRVLAAVSGRVYEDVNDNGLYDINDEPGIPGVVVYLDANDNGILDRDGYGMEPDNFVAGQVLNNSQQSIFPSATGADNVSAFRVQAAPVAAAPTGDLVFGQVDQSSWDSTRRLRFDFTVPADSASIDVVGNSAATVTVRLDAYNAAGELLERSSVSDLGGGTTERLTIQRTTKDVNYVVVYVADGRGTANFDNLRVDDAMDERATVTGSNGFYRIANIPDGPAILSQVEPADYQQTVPSPNKSFELDLNNAVSNLNFGNRTSSIGGIAFNDLGVVGVYEPAIDEPIAGVALFVDENGNGVADQRDVSIDPDSFLSDQILDFVSSDVSLRVVDANNQVNGESVVAAADTFASPDGQIFTHEGNAAWNANTRLRMNFTAPASLVEIDFIGGNPDGTEQGILVAYSPAGDEIASVTSRFLGPKQAQTLAISRGGNDIGYVVGYTVTDSGAGRFDNLRATTIRERVAITDSDGVYTFRPIDEGTYEIAALPTGGQAVTFPAESRYMTTLDIGDDDFDRDFGFQNTNDPPVARADVANTIEDTPVGIGVLVNDSDPDGVLNPGSIVVTQSPAHGTVEVTADGQLLYRPAENFNGRDTLLYTVRDDQATESNSAIVTINIAPSNDRPVAMDDEIAIRSLEPTVIGVTGNDVDIDDRLNLSTVEVISQPSNGSVVVNEVTGNITYTPASNAADSFTYSVDDMSGATSNVATVVISSLSTGTPPVATADNITVPEGTPTSIPVLTNDTDADGTIDVSSVVVVTLPTNGEAESQEDGTIVYRPTLGFIGSDSFTYVVRDNTGLSSNIATVLTTTTVRATPYQNPIEALDVNPDGAIAPQDALFIINEINSREFSDETTGALVELAVGSTPAGYYDVDGNGFVTAGDVLRIVNFINSQNAAAAAAEPPAEADVDLLFAASTANSTEFSAFDAFEDDDDDDDDEVVNFLV